VKLLKKQQGFAIIQIEKVLPESRRMEFRARDNNRVYVEPANKKPLSPADA
jgi:hypothetical protein